MTIEVSLCMTLHNRADLLALSVRRYAGFPSSRSAELIVVDDLSDDGLPTVLKEAAGIFGRVVWVRMDKLKSIIESKTNNPALGINLAIKRAGTEIIVKTDPECYPLTDVLGLAKLRFDPGRLIYARCIRGGERLNGRLKGWEGPFPDEGQIDMEGPYLWETKNFVCARTRWAYWFTVIVSRSLFARIGGVDERFLSGFAGEDDEFAERVARNGIEIRFDDLISVAHLWHPPPGAAEGQKFAGGPLHDRNKNLLYETRQRRPLVANVGHDWGSDSAIVSVEEVRP